MDRRQRTAVLTAGLLTLSLSGACGGKETSSTPPAPTSDILYVNQAAAAGGDGSSWASAYQQLGDALEAAEGAGATEIWVAEGTYLPTHSPAALYESLARDENADGSCADTSSQDFADARWNTFLMRSGVALYGGFAGTETERDQRDWQTRVTVLSGDLGGDDCYTTGTCGLPLNLGCDDSEPGFVASGQTYADNAYHVVMGAPDAVLDGFTIRGGNSSNSQSAGNACGLFGASSSQEIYRILSGFLSSSGGGVLIVQSDPVIRNATIEYNRAAKGGGVYMLTPTSPQPEASPFVPRFENVVVRHNFAVARGGGVANDWRSSPVFENAQIRSNACASKGGGVYSDMGCQPVFVNALIADNRAERAAGLTCDGSTGTFLAYATFTRNTACDIGSALYQGTHRVDDTTGNQAQLFASVVLDNQSTTSALALTHWMWSTAWISSESFVQLDETIRPANAESCLDAAYETAGSCAGIGWSASASRSTEDAEVAGWYADRVVSSATEPPDTSSTANAVNLYVDADAACGSSCDGSQAKPFASLRTALAAAGDGTLVYLAPGGYYATADGLDEAEAAFVVRDGVSLVGCLDAAFAQCADGAGVLPAVDAADDLLALALPVVSGASGAGDTTVEDNANHVFVLGRRVSLRGLVVRDGYADSAHRAGQGGGATGWKAEGLTVSHVVFRENHAVHGGALMLVNMPSGDTTSSIADSVFLANSAEQTGGAVNGRVGQLESSLGFTRVVFEGNASRLDRGGAVSFDYGFDGEFVDCRFVANSAAASSGGAVYADDNASQYPGTQLVFRGCTFSGNSAAVRGGAIEVYNSSTSVWLDESCAMTGNSDGTGANDVYVGFSGTLCTGAALGGLAVTQASSASVKASVPEASSCSTGGSGTGGGPPQAAIDACVGLSSGAACTFSDGGPTITGSCFLPPGASELACKPGGA